jgi:hypothetical protein
MKLDTTPCVNCGQPVSNESLNFVCVDLNGKCVGPFCEHCSSLIDQLFIARMGKAHKLVPEPAVLDLNSFYAMPPWVDQTPWADAPLSEWIKATKLPKPKTKKKKK